MKKSSNLDSIDMQIDKFLMSYEKESNNSKNESNDYRMIIKRLLAEAEEENKKESEEQPPEQKTLEDIDINNFATNIARLINNVDSLIDFQNSIIRRAVNYLNKSYDMTVSESMLDVLDQQFGMSIDSSAFDDELDNMKVPTADKAGPVE